MTSNWVGLWGSTLEDLCNRSSVKSVSLKELRQLVSVACQTSVVLSNAALTTFMTSNTQVKPQRCEGNRITNKQQYTIIMKNGLHKVCYSSRMFIMASKWFCCHCAAELRYYQTFHSLAAWSGFYFESLWTTPLLENWVLFVKHQNNRGHLRDLYSV